MKNVAGNRAQKVKQFHLDRSKKLVGNYSQEIFSGKLILIFEHYSNSQSGLRALRLANINTINRLLNYR